MNEKPVLALDVDGVFCDVISGICKVCTHLTGISVSPSEWLQYDHHINLGLSWRELAAALIEHQVLENAIPRPGIADAIRLAREQGLAIALVTARGFHPEAEAITSAWFESQQVHLDHMLVVGTYETKVHALSSLGNVVAYIDDCLSHLEEMESANLNIPLYLMDQPWNRGESRYPRFFSVPDFVEHVLAKAQSTDINATNDFSLSVT
jgi:uncharacterized HAD superfamily protein